MCELAARAPVAVVPLFIARIGLLQARRDARFARIGAGFRRTRGRGLPGSVRVVLPVLEQVVRRDVGLVPNGDEGREAKSSLTRLSSRASPSAPLCDESRSDPAATHAARRSHSRLGAETAIPRQLGRRALRRGSGRPAQVAPALPPPHRPAKPAEITQIVLFRGRAPPRPRRARIAREADDHQVRHARELAHGAVSADPGDRFAPTVHGVDDAGELGFNDVAEEPAADGVPPPRGAEDGNARWGEEGSSEAAAARQGPVDRCGRDTWRSARSGSRPRARAFQLRETSKPASSNTFSIGRFSARTSATNRPMPASAALGETLQQPGRSSALMLVGDRERHFAALVSRSRMKTARRRTRSSLRSVGAALDPVRVEKRLDTASGRPTADRESGGRGSSSRGSRADPRARGHRHAPATADAGRFRHGEARRARPRTRSTLLPVLH